MTEKRRASPSGRARPSGSDGHSPTDRELAMLAKAVGHPARVQILRFLLRRDSCMCGDIVEELPLAQSTVSQHLKILKGAGLIRGTIEGPRVCYCVEPKVLKRLKDLVADLRGPLSEDDDKRENQRCPKRPRPVTRAARRGACRFSTAT